MKKRLFSAALAAICAVSSLSAIASADETLTAAAGDYETVTTDSTELTAEGIATIPDIKVSLPKAINYIANPYKLSVSVTNSDGTTGNVSDKVLSPEYEIKNLGSSKVAISVTATATATTGVDVSTTGKIASKTDKEIAIWVGAGTSKTVKVKQSDGTTKEEVQWTYPTSYNAKTCALAVVPADEVLYTSADIVADPTNIKAYNTEVKKYVTAGAWATLNAQTGTDSDGKEISVAKNTLAADTSVLEASDWAVKSKAVAPAAVSLLTLNASAKDTTADKIKTYTKADFSKIDDALSTAGDTRTSADFVADSTKTYYIKTGKTQADIDALLSSGGAFANYIADVSDATERGNAKTALQALLTDTADDENAAYTEDYPVIAGTGRVKFGGDLNSTLTSGNWSSDDNVEVKVAFDIVLLSN